jgi:hypothetical protein
MLCLIHSCKLNTFVNCYLKYYLAYISVCIYGMFRPNTSIIMYTYMRPAEEEALLLVAKDRMIPARCEEEIMARLESPLALVNGPLEPSPEAHQPESIYTVRTLDRGLQEVP